MRVLWFTNSACGAAEKLSTKNNTGGWMSALENSFINQPGIELGICFYWHKKADIITHNNVTYYPIIRKSHIQKINTIGGEKCLQRQDKKELAELEYVVDSFKPDIIHIHGTEENFGLLLKETKIPVIISIQGILTVYLEKYFSGVPRYIALRYEPIIDKVKLKSIHRKYKLKAYKASREKEILRHARILLGRTSWDQNVTRILAPQASYMKQEEMLRDSFYKTNWSKDSFDTPLKIVSVITAGIYKGLETIIQTIDILNNIDVTVEWTIVGQSGTNLLPAIVKRWKKKSFHASQIKFKGSCSENAISALFVEHDIFCHTSHIENSSNSICEAMILGMPIIATNVGGTESLLENRKHGLLVQDGDAYSLAGTILELKNNFDLATQLGKNARDRALVRHNKESIVASLLQIYKNALD